MPKSHQPVYLRIIPNAAQQAFKKRKPQKKSVIRTLIYIGLLYYLFNTGILNYDHSMAKKKFYQAFSFIGLEQKIEELTRPEQIEVLEAQIEKVFGIKVSEVLANNEDRIDFVLENGKTVIVDISDSLSEQYETLKKLKDLEILEKGNLEKLREVDLSLGGSLFQKLKIPQ